MITPSFDHISLVVTDLPRAIAFYRDVLCLRETQRPPFNFPGAWFSLGAHRLHLIANTGNAAPASVVIDTRDRHFALRVADFEAALAHLASHGYRAELPAEDARHVRLNRTRLAGYLQAYIADPDRNIIEINADS